MHRASGQIVQKQGVYSHDFLFDKYIRLLDEIKRLQVVLREVNEIMPWYFYKTKAKEFEGLKR